MTEVRLALGPYVKYGCRDKMMKCLPFPLQSKHPVHMSDKEAKQNKITKYIKLRQDWVQFQLDFKRNCAIYVPL